MLRLPPFELRLPRSLGEAADMAASEGPRLRLVAGGTDLWPNMKRRHQKAEVVASLMGLPELGAIEANGELAIGATATLDIVQRDPRIRERYPALARAVASISSPPLRNMSTLGGNVLVDTRCTYYNQTEDWRRSISYCMKEEGTVCWVAPSSNHCLAHSASDSAPILWALGARVVLASVDGERILPISDLYRDDGIEYLGKRREEILTRIVLPRSAASGSCRSSFWKLRRRGSIDFGVLSVAVAVRVDRHGTVENASIVLGAVASTPRSADAAAESLLGKPFDEESIEEAARLARKAATPFDNTDYQAQWRHAMVEPYTTAALREAAGLEPGIPAPRIPTL